MDFCSSVKVFKAFTKMLPGVLGFFFCLGALYDVDLPARACDVSIAIAFPSGPSVCLYIYCRVLYFVYLGCASILVCLVLCAYIS